MVLVPESGGLLLSDLQESLLVLVLLPPQLLTQLLRRGLHLLQVAPLELQHFLSGSHILDQ